MDETDISRLEAACNEGRYLDLLRELEARVGTSWRGKSIAELSLGIRACSHLMLPAVGRRLLRRLEAEHPDHLRTWRHSVLELMRIGRTLDAFRKISSDELPRADDPLEQAMWHSTRAYVFTCFEDFGRAEAEIDEGERLCPDHPYLRYDRVAVHRRRDRVEEALELCRDQLSRHPDYPPLRHFEASILHEMNRGEEALEAFRKAHEQFQAPRISLSYSTCSSALGRPAEAREVVEKVLSTYRFSQRSRGALRKNLAFLCRISGDDDACLEYARKARKLGKPLALAIEAAGARRERVVLPVRFVRQDRQTCSPATMSALLGFFGVDVDQRDIADEITYDGTPEHRQLRWAEARGLRIRYFQFEADIAKKLLDAGFPFAMSTRYATSAHLQGVIGYDPWLGTFILREPGVNSLEEIPEATLVDQQRARGGGCVIIYPPGMEERFPLDELPFERESLASVLLYQELSESHWRNVEKHLATLRTMEPGPLLSGAERGIAYELDDYLGCARILREQLERAPQDEVCLYQLADALHDAGLWNEFREFLERECAREDCPPILQLMRARFLAEHASGVEGAKALVSRHHRHLSHSDFTYLTIAGIYWNTLDERPLALELYRFASCLSPHNEGRARSYFEGCKMLDRVDEGLDFLRRRHERMKDQSSWSAGTLALALEGLHRPDEAAAILEEALEGHDDRWVRGILFDLLVRLNRYDQARAHLESHRERQNPVAYWTSLSKLERAIGDREASLEALDQAIGHNRENADAQETRLQLIYELRGAEEARQEALRLAEEFDDHNVLLRRVYDQLWELGEKREGETILQRLIEANPQEHWLRAKLGRHLIFDGRPAEGLEISESLVEHLADRHALWLDIANARTLLGETAAGREAYRRCLELKPDNSTAIFGLLQCSISHEQAVEDLRFVAEQFRRRAPDADSLNAYVEHSERLLDAEERRGTLDTLQADYPGNPEVGLAFCEFLLRQENNEEAGALADSLAGRFAWSTPVNIVRARTLFARKEPERAREVLTRLTECAPEDHDAFSRLGTALEEDGDLQAAEAVYRRGIELNGSPVLYGHLADLLWQREERCAALEAIDKACELDRRYSWAFRTRVRWLCQLDREEEALEIARTTARDNPAWATAHRLLSNALFANGLHEESVEALYRALELDPRLGEARQILVRRLGRLGRFDEARRVAAEGFDLLGEEPQLAEAAITVERQAGDHAGSRAALLEMLERHPDHSSGWTTYLGWLEEDGETAEIVRLYEEAPPTLMEQATFHGYAAEALNDQGKQESAEKALRLALELSPRYDWARSYLGWVLSEQGREEEVGELYAVFVDPDAVGDELASRIAMNAARLGDGERAGRFLRRALRQPNASLGVLQEARRAAWKLDRTLWKKCAAAEEADDPHGYVAVNLTALAAKMGFVTTFWKRVNEAWKTGKDSEEGQARVAAMLSPSLHSPLRKEIGKWLHKHVKAPVLDVQLWGLYASATRPTRAKIQLMMPDYRRPGSEGWMLANLSGALLTHHRIEEMVEVSEYALTLPADHSKWWHRRYLAHDAYLRGHYDRVRELTEMPVKDFPATKLANETLAMLARVRTTEGFWKKRRELKSFLPVLFRLWGRVRAEDGRVDREEFDPGLIFRAIPCGISLMLRWGFTRGVLQRVYR